MAELGINAFKAKLKAGGARANLFQVKVSFPSYAEGNMELTSFMCKGAVLPASEIANIDVPFRGRQIKVAGDRVFQPWTITIINDNGMEVRNAFEKWMNEINSNESNIGLASPAEYQTDMIVEQLDKAGNVTKTYNIRAAFPTNISQIDLNFDTSNAIEEFTVELTYNYWTSPESATGE